MNKREVPFSIFVKLFKSRNPYSLLGVAFVFSSIFILLPGAVILINSLTEPYDKYDFGKIDQNGLEKTATVVELRPNYNVTINGENPLRIRYEYVMGGISKSDRYQTLDLDKTDGMKIGSKIVIKTLGDESKIIDLEPFTFPYYIFYLFPMVFFLIGLPFFLYGLIPALREYDLYKNGIIKEGTVISLIASSKSLMRNADQSPLIGYYYLNSIGERLFGESKITDYLAMKDLKVDDKIYLFISESDEAQSCIIPKYDAMKNNWKI